ncbi:MAG: family 20 glycosylhydrolase, partial [Chlorobi bacterium]|nr:family 20 glycosylhydrolase [Chlorobiota bacterium]
MKTIIFILSTYFLFTGIINSQNKSNGKVLDELLPVPQSIERLSGEFNISSNTKIYYSDKNPELKKNISRFIELSDLKLSIIKDEELEEFQIVIQNDSKVEPTNSKRGIENKGEEAYELLVSSDGISITSNSSKGVFWGLMTLAQLIVRHGSRAVIPNVNIIDWSRYPWRGYMLDTGRAPYSVGQIKRTIRICSAFKLNFLIIREGDDELNAFKYKNLPLGSDNPYALTLDDLSELIEYGKEYGITIFPEIESLGHAAAKRKFYPELIQGGLQEDYWPGFYHIRKSNFDVDNPKTYNILQAIYEEIFPRLSVPMVHLGLDEVRLP